MSPTESRFEAITVRTLLGARNLDFSIGCLRTLLEKSVLPIRLMVHSDGSLGPSEKEAICTKVGADVGFVDREEADDFVMPRLKNYPLLRAFRARDVMVKKLVDVTLMERTARMAYCDSDIIFFQKFDGLYGATRANEAMFMHDVRNCYAFGWNMEARRLFPIPERLNAGLIDYPTAAFDLDLVEHVLATRTLTNKLWEEQTIWAVLASRLKAVYADEIIVPEPQASPKGTLAWHLVTPLRQTWSLDDLIRLTSLNPEPIHHVALQPFSPATYPSYIASRTMGGLQRRALNLKHRLSP